MGILKHIFRQETKEEIKQREKLNKIKEQGINVNAPLIKNKIICNACGKEIINGVPKFLNCNGKRLVFHKKCLKKLKSGNVQF